MRAPINAFKAALREGRPQIGLWLSLGDAVAAELCAGAGFDWLLIDGEHGPNDIRTILAQLQAVAASPSHPIVRVPIGDTRMVKQMLDIGAQTLLVPMIESEAEAVAMARAMRYPPEGVRGVGAALARASAFGARGDYLASANDEVCLLLQVESVTALKSLEAIAGTEGVDGVFIGPADLAASMGFRGRPDAPEVRAAMTDAIARIRATGKAAGILSSNEALARHWLDLGATFVAVGSDVGLLGGGTRRLAKAFGRGA